MKKVKIILNAFAILQTIPVALMILSAHEGNVAYTCAMGFLALYMLLFNMLRDVNISLFNIIGFIFSVGKQMETEDQEDDEYTD